MKKIVQKTNVFRLLGLAMFSAICLTLLLPTVANASSAQAALIRSDPAAGAVLQTPPTQVHLWFSEDINPALSTIQVVNSSQGRVDNQVAQVNASDSTELDISVQANLPSDVYTVVWRTDSADDGHVLAGTFAFTIVSADGTVPQLAAGVNPGQTILEGSGLNTIGTLDATGIFNLLVVVLVELGAIFWMGAQFWLNFVLQNSAEKYPAEQDLNRQVERRFERRFSLPTLILLLLANVGVLYGQALYLTGGDLGAALSARLLGQEIMGVRFGIYWLMRMLVLGLALLVGIYMMLSKKRPSVVNQALPLLNLFLGAMLFVAMTMSGDATGANAVMLPYAVVLDWLHLVAAALWVGGMIYILLIYLPVLKTVTFNERTRSLLAMLPQYSPLAIAGVAIMAISGPLSVTFHLTSAEQFFTTGYGRALVLKILLICALLATGAYQLYWLRPRLKKEYQKYIYTEERLQKVLVEATDTVSETPEPVSVVSESSETREEAHAVVEVSKDKDLEPVGAVAGATEKRPQVEQSPATDSHRLLRQQVTLRQKRLEKKVEHLTKILRWEPWLGVAVIVCVGLMNVFAGPLAVTAASSTATSQNASGTPVAGPYKDTAKTSDGAYTVSLNVTPNRFGSNVFTVQLVDGGTGKPVNSSGISVTLYTTMLDMDMGTDSIDLRANGQGGFSVTQNLAMSGHWGIEIQVRTPDNQLHKANFTLDTPF